MMAVGSFIEFRGEKNKTSGRRIENKEGNEEEEEGKTIEMKRRRREK